MSGISSATDAIKNIPQRFDSWLKENEENVWIATGLGLGSFAATWQIYKYTVSKALKKDFERTCGFDVPVPDQKWKELVDRNSPPASQVWKRVGRDLKPLVPMTWNPLKYAKQFWNTTRILSQVTGVFTKSFLRLDRLWAINFLLVFAQEAQYWIGGTALEGAMSSVTSRITGLNSSWFVWPWMVAGFFGAQARRLYVMYYSQSLINMLRRPSAALCDEARASLPSLEPVVEETPRIAVELDPKVVERAGDVAKAAVVGTAGALTVWMVLESVLETVAAGIFIIIPPGLEDKIKNGNNINMI